ncbi:MAG: hypothetical protein ABID45_03445 [Patescibacteria group bacterium]
MGEDDIRRKQEKGGRKIDKAESEPLFTLRETIDFLYSLKNEYPEERPNEILRGEPAEGNISKWQGNWTSSIVLWVEVAKSHLIKQKQSVPEEIDQYLTYYKAREFSDGEPTLQNDIDRGNSILDLCITLLEKLEGK